MTMTREYWVDIVHEGVDYVVGANLHTHGDYTSYPEEDLVHNDPTFYEFVVIDPEDDTKELPYGDLKVSVTRVALKYLENVYWHITLNP